MSKRSAGKLPSVERISEGAGLGLDDLRPDEAVHRAFPDITPFEYHCVQLRHSEHHRLPRNLPSVKCLVRLDPAHQRLQCGRRSIMVGHLGPLLSQLGGDWRRSAKWRGRIRQRHDYDDHCGDRNYQGGQPSAAHAL